MSDELDPIGPKGWMVIVGGLVILVLMYGDLSCGPQGTYPPDVEYPDVCYGKWGPEAC